MLSTKDNYLDVFATVEEGEDIEVTEKNCEKAFAWDAVSAPDTFS